MGFNFNTHKLRWSSIKKIFSWFCFFFSVWGRANHTGKHWSEILSSWHDDKQILIILCCFWFRNLIIWMCSRKIADSIIAVVPISRNKRTEKRFSDFVWKFFVLFVSVCLCNLISNFAIKSIVFCCFGECSIQISSLGFNFTISEFDLSHVCAIEMGTLSEF